MNANQMIVDLAMEWQDKADCAEEANAPKHYNAAVAVAVVLWDVYDTLKRLQEDMERRREIWHMVEL